MRRYIATAVLFLFNNEVVSLIALLIMTAMFIAFIVGESIKHG